MIRSNCLSRVLAWVVLCACASAAPGSFGQSATRRPGGAAARAGKALGAGMELTPEEERILRGSRAELIATGFSEVYFDAHFEPVRVVNTPGDRRVTWRFRVGGHETLVHDSLGFYTDSSGRRVDTHTVAATLGRTHDILRTISLARASRVMRACIGEFEGSSITLQRFSADGRAALVFTAVSVPPREAEGVKGDVLAEVRKKKPHIRIGTVDLETGRCVAGVAQAGSPLPAPPKPRPRR